MRSVVMTAAAVMLLADLSARPSRIFSALYPLAQDRGETRNVLKIRVPATSSPYLAGLPAGTYTASGDRAPQQSPALVELPIENAAYVTFSASGNAQHHPFRPPRYDSPIGSLPVSHTAERGISQIGAPIDSLIGVFLDDNRPDQSPAPPPMNFGAAGWNSVLLEPQLKQVFLIGTGHVKARVDGSAKKSDVSRRFRVPRGATRLYLAVMDAYEWNNNEGYFDVTVTAERPETSSSAYNVDSSAYSVDSNATFAKWSCLPDRRQCTPDRAVVEVKDTRQYHVILPAQLEWGVSIPTPAGATVVVERVSGMVCLDSPSTGTNPCNGPNGSSERAGPEFLTPGKTVGELVSKTVGDKTYFSVNGRSGSTFQVYQGYFEFDVTMR